MKFATVLTLGFLTIASQAFADVANDAPLAAGKPAGIRTAQFEGSNGIFIVTGAALIGITVALATAGNGVSANNTGAGSSSASTTSTTP
jgi:hypothetical protein